MPSYTVLLAVPAVLRWYVLLATAFRCRVADRLLAPGRGATPIRRRR